MVKWLPVLILVVCFFMFLPNYKKGEEQFFHEMENGCLVYALHMKMVLDANERLEPHLWTRIVCIQFNKRLGHAILVFVYKNMTFIYDPAQGSFVAARYPLYDPKVLAEIAYPKTTVVAAAFLEPTLTLNYPPR
jgi:hypothetical protein